MYAEYTLLCIKQCREPCLHAVKHKRHHTFSTLQILCGRLRVMAQPHVREPAARPALEAAEAAGAAPHGLNFAAAQERDAAGGAWVPDVMRCRWRCAPEQRRLVPRLRANVRAMAMAALVLGVAATNSLVVPLALERRPATSQR